MIRDVLSDCTLEAAARLYKMFLRIKYTRGSAGYMLDDGIHNVFCKGGEWQIVRMAANRPGPKYTHWKNPEAATDVEYLRLGYQGHSITTDMQPLPQDTKYEGLPHREYICISKLALVGGNYYRPSFGSEETLNAFIYEAATKTVTIFQTTASKSHSVKEGGIEWLQSLGVETIRFIAVTPPETPLDLPFSNKWRTSVVPSNIFSFWTH